MESALYRRGIIMGKSLPELSVLRPRQGKFADVLFQKRQIICTDICLNVVVFLQIPRLNLFRLVRKGNGDQFRGPVPEIDIPVEVGKIHADAECIGAANDGHFGGPVTDVNTSGQRFIQDRFFRIGDRVRIMVIGHIGICRQLTQRKKTSKDREVSRFASHLRTESMEVIPMDSVIRALSPKGRQ